MIVQPDFLDHWKTQLLISLTNDESSPLAVIRLWGFCQTRRQHSFSQINPTMLKSICRFKGDADLLFNSLIECKFVDIVDSQFVVHQWDEVNQSLIKKWENGKLGGRPKKPNSNLEETYRLSVGSQNESDKSRVEKSRVEKYISEAHTKISIPSNEIEAIEMQGTAPRWPKEFTLKIFNEMQGINWIDGAGREVKSWPHYLSSRWAKEESYQNEKQARSNGNGYSKQIPIRSQQDIEEATKIKQNMADNAFKMEPSDIASFCKHSVSNGNLARIMSLSGKQYDYLLSIVKPEIEQEIKQKLQEKNGHAQRRC